MKIRVQEDTSEEAANAIARALAQHFEDSIEVYHHGSETPLATYSSTGESANEPETDSTRSDDTLGPTEREQRLWEEIEEIEDGGPKKYRDRLDEQGKLFVRDRLDLWFGDDGITFEDGKFAEFDAEERLPADGLLTGAAEFEGRDLHFMANDFTVKAGSMAEKGVEKFLRMQHRALKTGRPVLYLMDSSGGRIDQQTGFFANR
ncbi:MAG: carboxyl transferase domain-containing protein, partial [Halovenus sp.]